MSVRLLSDPLGLYYDLYDIFALASEGELWPDRWPVGLDRSAAVGDVAFIVAGEPGAPAILARGLIAAADERDQLRLLDRRDADLSAAYCRSLYGDSPSVAGAVLFVRFALESVVNPFASGEDEEDLDNLLPLADLAAQAGCDLLGLLDSGAALPEACAALIEQRWGEQITALQQYGEAVRVE